MVKSCSGQTVKLSAKAQETLIQDFTIIEKGLEVENLIFYLTNLLNSQNKDKRKKELYVKEYTKGADYGLQRDKSESPHKENLIILLATKINLVNVKNYNQFVCTMQFDTKRPEIYAQAMQELNTTQWAKIIEDKLD